MLALFFRWISTIGERARALSPKVAGLAAALVGSAAVLVAGEKLISLFDYIPRSAGVTLAFEKPAVFDNNYVQGDTIKEGLMIGNRGSVDVQFRVDKVELRTADGSIDFSYGAAPPVVPSGEQKYFTVSTTPPGPGSYRLIIYSSTRTSSWRSFSSLEPVEMPLTVWEEFPRVVALESQLFDNVQNDTGDYLSVRSELKVGRRVSGLSCRIELDSACHAQIEGLSFARRDMLAFGSSNAKNGLLTRNRSVSWKTKGIPAFRKEEIQILVKVKDYGGKDPVGLLNMECLEN
ncbi:MAG: hypothetical protein HC897_01465 [Thermoanaerobaculia bacterium]|nr:hypothetical protein [Thermoanaerobaculia bacterium]